MQQFLELNSIHKFSKIEEWVSQALNTATEQFRSLSNSSSLSLLNKNEINNIMEHYSHQVLKMRFLQLRCQQYSHGNDIVLSEKQGLANLEKRSTSLEDVSENIILILYDFLNNKNQPCFQSNKFL